MDELILTDEPKNIGLRDAIVDHPLNLWYWGGTKSYHFLVFELPYSSNGLIHKSIRVMSHDAVVLIDD